MNISYLRWGGVVCGALACLYLARASQDHLAYVDVNGIGGATIFRMFNATIYNASPYSVSAMEVQLISDAGEKSGFTMYGPFNCRFTEPLAPNDTGTCSLALPFALPDKTKIDWSIGRASIRTWNPVAVAALDASALAEATKNFVCARITLVSCLMKATDGTATAASK